MTTTALRKSMSIACALWISLTIAGPARADLDIETYIDLTIERLELIYTAWAETGESPTGQQLNELYDSYGIDSQGYLRYGGKKRTEIKRYLDEHDEERGTIESLSAAIRALIDGEEPE